MIALYIEGVQLMLGKNTNYLIMKWVFKYETRLEKVEGTSIGIWQDLVIMVNAFGTSCACQLYLSFVMFHELHLNQDIQVMFVDSLIKQRGPPNYVHDCVWSS